MTYVEIQQNFDTHQFPKSVTNDSLKISPRWGGGGDENSESTSLIVRKYPYQ